MFVGGACTSPTADSGSTASTAAGSIDPDEPQDLLPGGPPGSQALAELPGRLAITATGELVLTDPSGGDIEVVDSAEFLAQPTWAPTGQALAWTRADGDAAEVRLNAVETISAAEDPDVTVPTVPALPGADSEEASSTDDDLELVETIELGDRPAIYLQWNGDATRLGILQNRPDGVVPGIELSTAVVADGQIERVAGGPSVYFSWALEGSGLAVHQGTDVVLVPAEAGAPPLAQSERWFTAPAWLAAETLLVATAGSLDRVDVTTGEASSLVALEGPTEFVVNRNRSHVAFLQPGAGMLTVQAPNPDPGAEPDPEADSEPDAPTASASDEPGALQVLGLDTGDLTLVGLRAGEAVTPVAFEWSPDGSLLAFLAPSELQPGLLRWYFWQMGPGGGNVVGATTAFTPSAVSVAQYLPFFAQYAQSATGWSPNSIAFAFAGSIDAVSGIFIHVLGETPQSVYVGPGDYVTWSPANVQGAGRSFL